MKKVLLFDFGCILVGLSKERCIAALKKIGCERIAYYVDECRQEDLFHDLEVGGSIEAFCDEARRQSSYIDEMGVFHPCTATNDEICWAWNELLTGVPAEKLRLVKHLHDDQGYHTAILSNTNEIHWIKSVADFFTVDGYKVEDYFDQIFLSCDLGMVKPDGCIYEEVKKRLGDYESVLFIDDSEKNCIAAEKYGISTLHDPKGTLWMRRFAPKAAIIGNFDGVHRGHQYVMERLKSISSERGLMPTAITFDRHPRTLFDPSFTPRMLSTLKEKQQQLSEYIENVVVMPFDMELSKVSAYDFMKHILRDKLNVKVLLLGYDNRFGKRNAEENYDAYRRYGEELGIEVLLNDALSVSDFNVSSSKVRHLVAEGDMEMAAECLGRHYSISGTVVKGFQEGRKIGFPTVNIIPTEDKLLPRNGVYSTLVNIDGMGEKEYKGITNVGTRPTYNGDSLTVETHLLDFNGDLYGRDITVRFLHKVRDEQCFSSAEELREQIKRDIESTIK